MTERAVGTATPATARDGAGLRVGVIGGGALGLAAALRLLQGGAQVTLFEREAQLGGLAVGFRVGASALEKFYHHIFRTDTTIIRFIDEVGLSARLVWAQPDTSVLWQGRQASLDSPTDVLRFPFLPLVDRLRLAAGLAVLKLAPNERPFAGQTAAGWLRRVMGPRVYAVLWEPLLRGKFGARAEEIAMGWFWSRVHERTPSLGYLRGGFQAFYDALGQRIADLGGTVCTASAVRALYPPPDDGRRGGAVLETEAGTTYDFDQVLVTLPTRLFTRVARGLPTDYVARYQGPDHYWAHCVILALNRPLTDVYWLNINDPGFPFLALVEHTNLMPAADYGGRHLVYLGNYVPPDHPLVRQEDATTLQQFLAALPRLRPEFDPGWVQEHWVFKAPFAQPIVTTDYLSMLPPHETPWPGVFLANMAHVYPQDRGQNYSLRLGERMASRMLAAVGR
ncbi:MAG TPA: NAD(P)/FAD-dependent oxidoreductase [Chloroflexota bacterium]|nr:NAD(P)/FAD-dependent oxidoreductase [Chloroflexota bacterium]